MGFLKLYIGCMFSGKTSEIIKEYYKHMGIDKKVFCINYSLDNRYGKDEYIYNHNSIKIKCNLCLNLNELDDEKIREADCIIINEGQFFPDLVEYAVRWCETYNKKVYVCGLDGDYRRQKFGTILDLIPYADTVEKVHAFCSVCKDGYTLANFTHRLSGEKDQIVIGSKNYIPVCRKHYLLFNNMKN